MDNYIIIHLPYSEIYKEKLTIGEADKLIAEYPLPVIIDTLARIDSTLSDQDEARIIENQRALLGKMHLKQEFLDKIASAADALMKKENCRVIIFHELQLLNAAKIALMYCRNRTGLGNPDKGFDTLVKALLIINDNLGPGFIPEDHLTSEKLKQLLIPNIIFHHRDDTLRTIGRWHTMFIELPTTLKADPNYLDIDVLFKKSTGFDLTFYTFYTFALLTLFLSDGQKAIDGGSVLIDAKRWNHNYILSRREKKIILIVSEDARKLWSKIKKISKWREPYFLLPFRQTPLIRIAKRFLGIRISEKIWCINLRLLSEKISTGIYHIILTYLNIEKDYIGFRKLTAFRGSLFHCYVDDLLKRMYPASTNSQSSKYISLIKYKNDQEKISDGVILLDDYAIVIETKSRLFTQEVLVEGDLVKFREEINKMFTGEEGGPQVENTIKQIEHYNFTKEGIDPSKIKAYYPVFVTLQYVPIEPLLYKEIEDNFKERKILQGPKIAPFQIIYVDVFEMAEPLVKKYGISIVEILKNKNLYPEKRGQDFRNYFIEWLTFKKLSVVQNDFLVEQWNKFKNATLNFWFLREKIPSQPSNRLPK